MLPILFLLSKEHNQELIHAAASFAHHALNRGWEQQQPELALEIRIP